MKKIRGREFNIFHLTKCNEAFSSLISYKENKELFYTYGKQTKKIHSDTLYLEFYLQVLPIPMWTIILKNSKVMAYILFPKFFKVGGKQSLDLI